MNLLFAINQNYISLLKTCIRSVLKNGGAEHYDAYILHSDLNAFDYETIRAAAGERMCCHFVHVDEAIFQGFPVSSRYPKQIYYRLAAPLLLPQALDRILYLDVDLVVINPLTELYAMDFGDDLYIACSHVKELLTRVNQLRLGVEEDVPYINTGMMLMDLSKLRHQVSIEKLRTAAQKKMHTFILPDQDLLTVMHGDRIRLVDTMRYNLSDRLLSAWNADPRNKNLDLEWVKKNAVIIHYYGKNRPWKERYSGILDVFYHEIAADQNSEKEIGFGTDQEA